MGVTVIVVWLVGGIYGLTIIVVWLVGGIYGLTIIVVWLVGGIYGHDYYSGVASGWNLSVWLTAWRWVWLECC